MARHGFEDCVDRSDSQPKGSCDHECDKRRSERSSTTSLPSYEYDKADSPVLTRYHVRSTFYSLIAISLVTSYAEPRGKKCNGYKELLYISNRIFCRLAF